MTTCREVAAHPGAIIAALAARDRLDAAIAAAVGEFDRDQSWALDGARSMKAWLVELHRAVPPRRRPPRT